MDAFIANKLVLYEELLVMLYAEKFMSYPDPAGYAARYAEYVQSKIEQVRLPGVPEQAGMAIEAEFARFWQEVIRKLPQPGAGPAAE
jgi:hypothetical protein